MDDAHPANALLLSTPWDGAVSETEVKERARDVAASLGVGDL